MLIQYSPTDINRLYGVTSPVACPVCGSSTNVQCVAQPFDMPPINPALAAHELRRSVNKI